jgi:hypothetical protein
VSFPLDSPRAGDRSELAVDFLDQGADRERPQAKGARTVRDRRVVESAPGEPEQVVAEGDHRQQMGALILRDFRLRFAEYQVKPGSERRKLAAQLMAEIGEDGAKLNGIDKDVNCAGAVSTRVRRRQLDLRALQVVAHWPRARALARRSCPVPGRSLGQPAVISSPPGA